MNDDAASFAAEIHFENINQLHDDQQSIRKMLSDFLMLL